MADYALGLNATGLKSVAVTGGQNWSQRDLGSIGSMSLCTELWPQKDHFRGNWVNSREAKNQMSLETV